MSTPIVFWDVDTQVDFMRPDGALYVPGAEEITDNLERLTEAASRLSIPVVADSDDHELSDPEISLDPDFQDTFPPHCMRGSAGARRIGATALDWSLELGHEPRSLNDIRTALDTAWPRVLLQKKELDVFSNPNAVKVLEVLRPQEIVVYGVALDFCVRCVVEGLLELGVESIVVLTDATRAIYTEQSDELFRRWAEAGVWLETTVSYLDRLDALRRVAVG